jgi:hypothetical protein
MDSAGTSGTWAVIYHTMLLLHTHVALIVIAIALKSHKPQMLATNNETKIVVFLIVDNFPVSEFYVPTFRNTLSVPSS